MGTMEGFLLGQALAPDCDTGPEWEARAMREQARKEKAQAEVQKLSVALEKEHKRFLVERQERRNYMRGWAVRGQVLREMCGYSEDRIVADSRVIADKHEDKITKMADEKDVEINQQSGF